MCIGNCNSLLMMLLFLSSTNTVYEHPNIRVGLPWNWHQQVWSFFSDTDDFIPCKLKCRYATHMFEKAEVMQTLPYWMISLMRTTGEFHLSLTPCLLMPPVKGVPSLSDVHSPCRPLRQRRSTQCVCASLRCLLFQVWHKCHVAAAAVNHLSAVK